MSVVLEIYCDSSTTGFGIDIPDVEKQIAGKYDKKMTVNEGEFTAMYCTLELASKYTKPALEIYIYSDSQLVVNTLKGKPVKAKNLKELASKCCLLYSQLIPRGVKVKKIGREHNKEADRLSQLSKRSDFKWKK